MKYTLEIKESAKEGVIEAVLYYENQQEHLGVRFLDRWDACLESLWQEPFIYQKKYKNFRQSLIKPFPYHIIYEIEDEIIVVYKVVYGGRNPRKRYTKR